MGGSFVSYTDRPSSGWRANQLRAFAFSLSAFSRIRSCQPGSGGSGGLADLEQEVYDPAVLLKSEQFVGPVELALRQDIPDRADPRDQFVVNPAEGRL